MADEQMMAFVLLTLGCAEPTTPNHRTGDSAVRDTADSANKADAPLTVPGTDLVIVPIAAGSFTMGSPPEEVGRSADETAHRVTLGRPFYIGATEVTLGQFEAALGYAPHDDRMCGEQCPARWLSWHEAAAFSNTLSARESLPTCYVCTGEGPSVDCAENTGDCSGYRLPTEAEWEYAARAGEDAALHSGGNLLAGTEENCAGHLALDNGGSLDDIAWYCGNANASIQPVATLAPNAWGVFDTTGNVYEWTNDWFAAFSAEDAVEPRGPDSGSQRVHKGGSWGSFPTNCRHANRAPTDPTFTTGGLGFRIARDTPAP